MKIYRISQNISEKTIRAFHGTNKPFDKFDRNFSAQGVFWFSEDIELIKNEESGAVSSKYIASVDLRVNNVAGWDDYDRKFLDQIEQEGFDSVKLDQYWIIFDSNRIKINEWYKRQEDGSYKVI